MSERHRARILWLGLAQTHTLLLGLVGIALIPVISYLAALGGSGDAPPAWVTSLLDGLGLAGVPFSGLAGALAAAAALLLVLKTVLYGYLMARTFLFLSACQGRVSKEVLEDAMLGPLDNLESVPAQ